MINKFLNKLLPKSYRLSSRLPRYNDEFYTSDQSRVELDRSGFLRFFTDDDNLSGFVSREEMIEQGYAINPYVFTVVDRLVAMGVRLERIIVEKKTYKPVNNLPDELQKLLTQPNPINTFKDLIYRIDSNIRVTGESFLVAFTPVGFNQPTELIVPTSKNVTINEDTNGMPLDYDISYHDNYYNKIPKERVLHIKRPDISKDSLHGLSPLQANRFTYLSNNEVWSSEYFLHKNKGVNGIITNEGQRPLTPSEKAELQHQYDRESTGTNFGKVKVSGSKLNFVRMGMNMSDLKSIESRLDHLRQICASQGVDSKLFGDPAASTYNNVPEAKRAAYTDSILPMADKINEEISNWLFPKFGIEDAYIKVDLDKIAELNKPNIELSQKIISEYQAGLLPKEFALAMLYDKYFEMPENLDELLNNDTSGDGNQG